MINNRSQSSVKQRKNGKSVEVPAPFKVKTPPKMRFDPETSVFVARNAGLKRNLNKKNNQSAINTQPTPYRRVKKDQLISQAVNPQTHLDINAAKRKNLNNSRIRLQYLKKNLTKSTCNLSILDFWTNEMLANTIKLMHKPAKKLKSRLPLPNVSKNADFLKKKSINCKNSFSNLDDYLKKIDSICNSTVSEMQALKSDLKNSMDTISKLN